MKNDTLLTEIANSYFFSYIWQNYITKYTKL